MFSAFLPYLLVSTLSAGLLVQDVVAKEIDSKTDLQQEESVQLPAEHRQFLPPSGGGGPPGSKTQPGHQPSPSETHDLWPQGRSDMPQIKSLNVKCEKNHMKVNVEFDRPFYGMVFSKGHYSDPKCVHLPPGTGHLTANFDIFLGACGMSSNDQGAGGPPGTGLFIENTVIVQYDPQVQEIWDQARRLKCTWYDYYEKAVTFRAFNVDMLDAVTANFLGDNIQCWMQIQVGKGPWASEVAGIVKIGQTMTMVLAIKDDENKFDMLVRNCIAHDGKHQPIQLVDDMGCVIRPKIMSRFQKVKNFGHSATVVSYAYFQAFKFPDSMNVHFQCVIQVCRFECPEPACESNGGEYSPGPRDSSESKQGPYITGPSNNNNNNNSNKKHPIASSSSRHPVMRTPSTPAGTFPAKILMNRKGEIPVSGGYAISGTGGMPRALPIDSLSRKKRQSVRGQFTDIKTQKVIQVVAPGDLAFTLPTDDNESVVEDSLSSRVELDTNSVCLSTSGFAAGLVLLLLLLIVSCLIASFLFMRVRQISETVFKCTESVINYENPEFLKIPTMAAFHGLTH